MRLNIIVKTKTCIIKVVASCSTKNDQVMLETHPIDYLVLEGDFLVGE